MANKVLFTSGFKVGSGLAFQLDSKVHERITYLDTPGLAGVNLQMKAAQAISKALKKKKWNISNIFCNYIIIRKNST